MDLTFLMADTPSNHVTEDYIKEVEHQYQIQFPELLRRYYLQNDGKTIRTSVIEVNGITHWITDFFPLIGAGFTLGELLHRQRMQNYPVRQMIPFAEDDADGIYYVHMITNAINFSTLEGEDFTFICTGIDHFFQIMNEACQRDEDDPYDITSIRRSDKNMASYDFLPLGSIVLLQGGTRKVMIIARGMNVKRGDDTYFFDYAGVLYPEGLTSDQVAYFNQDGIVKVYFHGYRDDEDDTVATALKNYLETHPNLNRADPATWNPEE